MKTGKKNRNEMYCPYCDQRLIRRGFYYWNFKKEQWWMCVNKNCKLYGKRIRQTELSKYARKGW